MIQANLKQRPVPKKLKWMTGCTFDLKTTTCTHKNNVGRVAGGLKGQWAQLHAGAEHPARPSAQPLQPWDMDAHVHRAQQSISKKSPAATEASKESLNNGRTGENELLKWAERSSYKLKMKSCQSWQWKTENKKWGILQSWGKPWQGKGIPHCKGHLLDIMALFNGHHPANRLQMYSTRASTNHVVVHLF